MTFLLALLAACHTAPCDAAALRISGHVMDSATMTVESQDVSGAQLVTTTTRHNYAGATTERLLLLGTGPVIARAGADGVSYALPAGVVAYRVPVGVDVVAFVKRKKKRKQRA